MGNTKKYVAMQISVLLYFYALESVMFCSNATVKFSIFTFISNGRTVQSKKNGSKFKASNFVTYRFFFCLIIYQMMLSSIHEKCTGAT